MAFDIDFASNPIKVVKGGGKVTQPLDQGMDVSGADLLDLQAGVLAGNPALLTVTIYTSMEKDTTDGRTIAYTGACTGAAPNWDTVFTAPAGGKVLLHYAWYEFLNNDPMLDALVTLRGMARRKSL